MGAKVVALSTDEGKASHAVLPSGLLGCDVSNRCQAHCLAPQQLSGKAGAAQPAGLHSRSSQRQGAALDRSNVEGQVSQGGAQVR